jgi:PPK2 family polyphosphate:nucleotide phosphotransferase
MSRFDQYRVNPKNFRIKDFDPNDRSERSGNKGQDIIDLCELQTQINKVQDVLHAEGKRKVLLVLQGMDASGKDGTVRHVLGGCDPLGIRIASFKKPTSHELAHDYLWRVHNQVPKAGELTVFNRSHYEDVLIVKVHDWIDSKTCKQRYQHIKDFEKMLTDTGTTIIKCFIHISKDEQKERFQARLDEPDKTWKFNPGDLVERAKWDDYMAAYEDAMKATSTKKAPWYVIPADSKTNRNLLISRILLKTLKDMKLKHPKAPEGYDSIVIED